MRRLRLPFKVGLIGPMLFVPRLLRLGTSLRDGLHGRRGTLIAHQGALVVREVLRTVSELQAACGLNHRVLDGDTDAAPQRDAARLRLAKQLQAVDARLLSSPAVPLADVRVPVRDAVGALAQGRHDPARPAGFRQHTEPVEALRQVILAAA